MKCQEQFLLTRLMRGAALLMEQMDEFAEISTHAPHARRGQKVGAIDDYVIEFLLTRLMRGAAFKTSAKRSSVVDFYSRASCEARRHLAKHNLAFKVFLLTRLMRGAALRRSAP